MTRMYFYNIKFSKLYLNIFQMTRLNQIYQIPQILTETQTLSINRSDEGIQIIKGIYIFENYPPIPLLTYWEDGWGSFNVTLEEKL